MRLCQREEPNSDLGHHPDALPAAPSVREDLVECGDTDQNVDDLRELIAENFGDYAVAEKALDSPRESADGEKDEGDHMSVFHISI